MIANLAGSMQPLLQIKNLSVDFSSGSHVTSALKNITITVKRGEIVALVGESGSGKSVTSLSVLQLVPVPPAKFVSGEILFSEDGQQVIDLLRRNRYEMQDIRGNKIGMIFQEPMTSLNPVLTCGEQVMETILRHKKITAAEARQQTISWFEKVKLPDPANIFKRYPHQLSGGQKQRVMIAIAMCCEPALLICDEPTTALDVTVQKTILDLIRDLQRQSGMGVIFITHDLGVVAEIADRAVVMYQGTIVEQNSVKDIFSSPVHPYTKALLACRPVNHRRGERLPVVADFMEETKPQKQFKHLPDPVFASEKKQPEVLLKVEELSVWFPAARTFLGKVKSWTKAVDEVSFEVYQGETLGLVGESGCGKTTLGRTILRLIEPTSGRIIYNGTDLTSKKPGELQSLRKEVQIVFQDPYSSLNPRIMVGAAISEPLKVHGMENSGRRRKDKVIDLLEKVDLRPEHYNRYPHEFSGGQRQRIVIARALAMGPSFIVCDESVSALDVSVQAQVLNLLNDLKKEMGFTMIFISHDLSVVRYISNRIMVMNKGKIEELGPADEIYYQPGSAYTKKLISSVPGGVFT
jgi:peptide/nickel transport system ATP-binding protein